MPANASAGNVRRAAVAGLVLEGQPGQAAFTVMFTASISS